MHPSDTDEQRIANLEERLEQLEAYVEVLLREAQILATPIDWPRWTDDTSTVGPTTSTYAPSQYESANDDDLDGILDDLVERFPALWRALANT